ncbi:DNA repair protein RecN [Eubacterium xylanophilum]|uniref:DNA repair protein RecN n=1 Tax=Eubacterium xylanophilum TaxID=39497 RepID=UPI00047CBBDE|nr:DNA repair protein RecN [Eubacterium xylanophilum]
MLVNLHVKNFAIIDEIDVDFGDRLNILTGETGAGKSIIIGSINIALGGRVSSEMIGNNGDNAMVELVFQVEDDSVIAALEELGVETEDGQIVISRRITANRSVNKINGESVSVSTIKKVAAYLIDIHGQHEHQSLLKKEYHMEVLDRYIGDEAGEIKDEIKVLYGKYSAIQRELDSDNLTPEERERQLSFMIYERDEIENANIQQGEEEELAEEVRKLSYSARIMENLSSVRELICGSSDSCEDYVGRALREITEIADIDDKIGLLREELCEIEDLIVGFDHSLKDYMDSVIYDESEIREKEQRLDLIRSCQRKYGSTYVEIKQYYDDLCDKIKKYEDFEVYRQELKDQRDEIEQKLDRLCDRLSELRHASAGKLEVEIIDTLEDLNFEKVRFEIAINRLDSFTSKGREEVEFLVAPNPGTSLNPLAKVASGGELSRIMLAIKSVFAGVDNIGTLIFDEIDTGISGRTAQKVSEKMAAIASKHQVLCITHLAQIAAMADTHFIIQKNVTSDDTKTCIERIDDNQIEEELARMLGGATITETVISNAREMKEQANKLKNRL